jgi:Lon protease-like protein
MSEVIRVNFGKPMPLFPLPDAVLLPHAIQPLHIFEPRYCAMIDDCLDKSGQIAMASFEGEAWKNEYDNGLPALRSAVCVGQIVHHDALPDGRHNIMLHGVCRARIQEIIEPDDDRPYRLAQLVPLENVEEDPPPLTEVRGELHRLLGGPRLCRMRSVETVMEWFNRSDVSTHALLELIGFALVRDNEVKYRLLAEPCVERRARLLKGELRRIDHLVGRAEHQSYRDWPKGMSWN